MPVCRRSLLSKPVCRTSDTLPELAPKDAERFGRAENVLKLTGRSEAVRDYVKPCFCELFQAWNVASSSYTCHVSTPKMFLSASRKAAFREETKFTKRSLFHLLCIPLPYESKKKNISQRIRRSCVARNMRETATIPEARRKVRALLLIQA